jgi:hypothetical protein
MLYLQRVKMRPNLDDLNPGESRFVHGNFDVYAGEVIVEGQSVAWNEIEEVEVAVAARAIGPAGWVVRYLVHGNPRYHVGLYFGHEEVVVRNITLNVAQYIIRCVAFYAPLPVRYIGSDELSPVMKA